MRHAAQGAAHKGMLAWPCLLLPVLVLACVAEDAPPAACRARSDCPVGFACEAGRCVGEPRCVADADCCPGSHCIEGACRRFTTCTDRCSERDTACEAGLCVTAPCGPDAPCSRSDRQCIAGRCVGVPACGGCEDGTVCEPLTGQCLRTTAACFTAACAPGSVALVSNGADLMTLACAADSATCACVPLPPLSPPVLGAWLDAVADADGAWLVGYDLAYGDLVVSRSGEAPRSVAGVPPGPIVASPTGPRGGVAAPGPDVGRFARAEGSSDGLVILSHDTASRSPLLTRIGSGGEATHQVIPAGDTSGLGGDLLSRGGASLVASWWRLRSDGGFELQLGRSPGASAGWTVETLETEGPALPAECTPTCPALMACTVGFQAPSCAYPDLAATCDPGCDLSHLCIEGACARRAEVAPRPFFDAPGGNTRLAVWGDDVLIAALDQRAGTLDLWEDGAQRGVEGGAGHTLGSGLALATRPGELVLAYEDESAGGLVVAVGPAPGALSIAPIGAGGRAPSALMDASGRIVVVYGGPASRGLMVSTRESGVWSTAALSDTPLAGRATALAAQGATGTTTAWTLSDALTDSPGGARLTTRVHLHPVSP